ncbi:MAG TPA: universal stress protein [Terrimicrobiaceae bacterium]
MKTLLVPVDLSDVSKPVLEKTAELAQQLSARVVVLHVAEPVARCAPVEATEDLVIPSPPPVDTMGNISATNSRLKSLSEPLEAVGVKVETVTDVGFVVDDIFEEAAKYHADYIILGSHGHGVLYHLFSKSVVTHTLERANCPIIVVPSRCETRKC